MKLSALRISSGLGLLLVSVTASANKRSKTRPVEQGGQAFQKHDATGRRSGLWIAKHENGQYSVISKQNPNHASSKFNRVLQDVGNWMKVEVKTDKNGKTDQWWISKEDPRLEMQSKFPPGQ